MYGKPMMVTSDSFHDMPNMKMKNPTALMKLRRNRLTFCEMRSLTCVVSEVSRDVMSPVWIQHQCLSPIFVSLVIIVPVMITVTIADDG